MPRFCLTPASALLFLEVVLLFVTLTRKVVCKDGRKDNLHLQFEQSFSSAWSVTVWRTMVSFFFTDNITSQAAGRVETDEIVDLSPTDDTKTLHQVSFLACLYFDTAQLDPGKICGALETLLTSSHEWRYLGGRLRFDEEVRLCEVRLFQYFTQYDGC